MVNNMTKCIIVLATIHSFYAESVFNKYLVEDQFELILKRVDYQRIIKSLPEHKNAENQYKLYVEDQQKQLTDKANKIQKDSEELEAQWSEKKAEMLKIQDREEYEEEYKAEEANYFNRKKVLEEKYRLLMGEQNTMEADAKVKRNELFGPVEKKSVKLIDEFVAELEKKMSEFSLQKNKKPVKIICINSGAIVNSESHIKNVANLDITQDVLVFIKSKNIAIDALDTPSDNLKNKKNKKK